MSPGEEKVWRAADLRWRSWDQQWAVYNIASGNTHLLTAIAAEILRVLEHKPATAVDLSQKLAASASLRPDEELIDQVRKLLANLDDMGLIESVPQCKSTI